jgi:flagellar FliL protein
MPVPEDRRTTATPTPDNVPPAAAAPAPARGGITPWLPLIITILLMPVLAYATTVFVLLPRIQTGLGMTTPAAEPGAKPKATAPGAKKITVPINKLLVNVAGTMGSRYLLVSMSLASTDPAFQQKMTDADAALRDAASSALASKTLADLEKPDERNLIRTELLSSFNNILGSDEVSELYLTEFAIQ